MKISTETVGRLLASGRNYASTIVGFVGGVGIISAAQSKGLTDALNEIISGVSQIVHGATSMWQILVVAFPIIGVVMARYASKSAKTSNQASAVQAAVADPNSSVSAEAKVAIVNAAAALPEVEKVVAPPLASNPATSAAVVKS